MRDCLLIYYYGWWVLPGLVITLFADEGLVACILLWLMGPAWPCDHLVCRWGTSCLFIVMVDGSCLALWSPCLRMRDWLLYLLLWLMGPVWHCDHLVCIWLVAYLLLWLIGPVRHCDHLVCGWETGCLFIVIVDGSCLALWSPCLRMRDWLLV